MGSKDDEKATRRPGGNVFVGRQWEVSQLRAGVEDALAGRGRLFLVSGEPGIGKTRLAEELAHHAARRGAHVWWGRCWEEGGAPAFWPWIQVLRACLDDPDRRDLLRRLGPQGGEIERLVSDVRQGTDLFDETNPRAAFSGEQARFRLFDAVATLIRSGSRTDPWVLVFDDLHGADRPSLRLLHFVARELRDMRVLLLGNYRDREMARAAQADDLLGELAREGKELHLRGLSRADLRSFVEEWSGVSSSDTLVEALHDATGGNPFFVEEIVRQWAAQATAEPQALEGGSLAVPRGVREAVRRRFADLSDDARRVLSFASFMGRELSLEALQRVSGVPMDQLLARLAEAASAGVIDRAAQSHGPYHFAHALLREALYDEVSLAERIARHQQIGEALEGLYGAALEPRLAELAHHFFEAAAAGGPIVERALGYAKRAGDHAARLLAYEEAAIQYERALQLLDHTAPDDADRFELLMVLGEARARAGEHGPAQDAFRAAAELAKRLGAPPLLARAALGFTGTAPRLGSADQAMVDMLEEALGALDDRDSALRATLMGRLAHRRYYSSPIEYRLALSERAVEMARRLDHSGALAHALNDRLHALWGPHSPDDVVEVGGEIVRLARAVGDTALVLHGYAWRIGGLLERDRISELSADVEAMARQAQEFRMPIYRWMVMCTRATLALLDGRYEAGEQLAREAYPIGRGAKEENAPLLALHLWFARRDQGRLGEVASLFDDLGAEYVKIPLWRCARAVFHVETGRLDEARGEFEQLAADGFEALRRDHRWVFAMACLADLCTSLGDAERAPRLYQMLSPFAGRHVVLGHGWMGRGSVSLHLGLLAAAMCEWPTAARHYEEALASHARIGAAPLLARTQHEYARMLVARNEPGDRERALELIERALPTTARLGLRALHEKLEATRRALERAAPPRSAADGDSFGAPGAQREGRPGVVQQAPALPCAILALDGKYWRITFQGEVFRLKDASGFHYLRELLRQPGQKVHLTELLAAVEGGPEAFANGVQRSGRETSIRSSPLGDAGTVLDAQAKAAYRQRLAELREARDEAEQLGNAARALAAEEEIELLTRELARAVGWGGRDRRAASGLERSRIRVAKAIRVAIRRVEEASPLLGRHLATAIKTGTFCSYSPDPSSQLQIEL